MKNEVSPQGNPSQKSQPVPEQAANQNPSSASELQGQPVITKPPIAPQVPTQMLVNQPPITAPINFQRPMQTNSQASEAENSKQANTNEAEESKSNKIDAQLLEEAGSFVAMLFEQIKEIMKMENDLQSFFSKFFQLLKRCVEYVQKYAKLKTEYEKTGELSEPSRKELKTLNGDMQKTADDLRNYTNRANPVNPASVNPADQVGFINSTGQVNPVPVNLVNSAGPANLVNPTGQTNLTNLTNSAAVANPQPAAAVPTAPNQANQTNLVVPANQVAVDPQPAQNQTTLPPLTPEESRVLQDVTGKAFQSALDKGNTTEGLNVLIYRDQVKNNPAVRKQFFEQNPIQKIGNSDGLSTDAASSIITSAV